MHRAQRSVLLAVVGLLATAVLSGCLGSSGNPTPGPALSPTELKYRLVDTFGPPLYCDRDFYPVGRDEQQAALAQFPSVSQDTAVFSVILRRQGLDAGSTFTPQQKLAIYRDYKKLQAIALEPSGAKYAFALTASQPAGRSQGDRIEGLMDQRGTIEIKRRTPTFVNCPICLAEGTRIDTPDGPVPVTELRAGMAVWTVDRFGARSQGNILETAHVPAPPGHQMVHLVLSDGRELLASPGHPTADGRRLSQLAPGDRLDGARVVTAERVPYQGAATFDLLPSGETGAYWADGILIGSTLAPLAP